MAGTGHWIAFGPGMRECSAPFLSAWVRDYLSVDMERRLIFGLGAFIATGVFLIASAEALRDWGGLLKVGAC